MQVRGLGYITIESAKPESWREFGTQVLGAMPAPGLPDDGRVYLKLDERAFRIMIEPGARDRFGVAGWELGGAGALDAAARELESAGVPYKRGTPEQAQARRVGELLMLDDPAGNALELFHTPILEHSRFVSPVGVAGFVTGELGMGHVVLPAAELDAADAFYTGLLGFRPTDVMRVDPAAVPDRDPADGPARLHFYHCNPRHHSLALMEAGHPAGLVHLMLEVSSLDEVGYALDRCAAHGVPLSATLGRHVNDHTVSFYVQTPSGFDVEFGFGGRHVEPGNHTTTEITAVSYWGHRFAGPPAD